MAGICEGQLNTGHRWTRQEDTWLARRLESKPVDMNLEQLAGVLSKETGGNLTVPAIAQRLRKMRRGVVETSKYPIYDKPLEMVGDALVMTDVEFPFHHADFVNRCIELAQAWKIDKLILGGDALHFHSLSGWEPSWSETEDGGLSEEVADKLYAFAQTLKTKDRERAEELIAGIGEKKPGETLSEEMSLARKELLKLGGLFGQVDFILGNHEGRLLRAMETTMDPQELFRLLDIRDPKWRVSPYYYSVLWSGGEKFQIEHPRNTAKFSAWKLAAKFGCHVIQGHSHQLNYTFDISGKYYAIETGHCVDESRLAYSAQRHNTAHAHVLGASIVRGGVPWLLHAKTDWQAMKRL